MSNCRAHFLRAMYRNQSLKPLINDVKTSTLQSMICLKRVKFYACIVFDKLMRSDIIKLRQNENERGGCNASRGNHIC